MQSSSRNVNINKPTPSFLQAGCGGCPSCCPANSVKALKGEVLKRCGLTVAARKVLYRPTTYRFSPVKKQLQIPHSISASIRK